MKHTRHLLAAIAAGLLGAALLPATANAQQSDALLEMLVRKGILTEQDSEDLKADLAKENRQFVKVRALGKDTMSLDFYGDFRARYDGIFSDAPNFVDRNRPRYRLRFGATATLLDRFEAGLRFSSGEPVGSFGGDPISGNVTLQDNGSKKFIFLDLAYGRWYAVSNDLFHGTITVGKMENPFVYSDNVFDADYTPEGVGINMVLTPSLEHTVRLNLGGFSLDEVGNESDDPYLFGAQARWDAIWKYNEAHAPKIQSSVGIGILTLHNAVWLGTNTVPGVNRGNTRVATNVVGGNTLTGVLAYDFNPIVADVALTYTFDKMWAYPGPFPVRVGGDVIYNPPAPNSAGNKAFSAGITFGKAGKRRTWEVAYRWKYLGANSWFEEFVDSDFGGFYPGTLAHSGTGSGYGPGTNLKGHVVKVSYSPWNAVTLSATLYQTELISNGGITFATGSRNAAMSRVQVDALWKF